MRYLAAKNEALKESHYDISTYILTNKYYPITSKYQLSARQYILKKILLISGCLIILLIGCALFIAAIALSCLMINHFNYFGPSIACYFIGLALIVFSIGFIIFKSLHDVQKVVITFDTLLRIKAINPDLTMYPLLMQKLLVTFAKYQINSNAYWTVPSTLTWEVYMFIDFYHQLNEYYLQNSNHPLIEHKEK